MLTKKTTLGQSTIHGIGLFAAEPIIKNEIVWQFQPGFDMELTPEQRATLPPLTQEWFQRYGYLDFHLEKYMCCVDDARFMNHSDYANIHADYEKEKYGIGRALRNIEPGEELTIDYRQIENIDWLK
jgi:SET domain-containing protein